MVTHALQQPTRGVLIEVDTSRRIFGLAPTVVCRAVRVATNAVGSYPTFSPLPPREVAVCSLWHCQSRRQLSPPVPRSYLAVCPMEPGLSSNKYQGYLRAIARPIALVQYNILTLWNPQR